MLNRIHDYNILSTVYESDKTLIKRAIFRKNKLPVILKSYKTTKQEKSIHEKIASENKILTSCDNENIIKSYGVIKEPQNTYLILEDFDGNSLDQVIKKQKLSINEILVIGIAITNALEELYKHNIIHLSITPDNILFNQSGAKVKLVNFSNATVLSKQNLEIYEVNTSNTDIVYISPEQSGRINALIDYRSDFYSLGVTLYHLFVGYPPFHSSDTLELIHQHIAKEPDKITDWIPDFPKPLSEIVKKLLAKSPDKRYQSAKGLLADLEKCKFEIEENGKVNDFIIGQHDKQVKFTKTEKLYGREKELKLLNHRYNKVCKGSSEIVLVSGEAGIGKSSLVNELRKNVLENDGIFISGKFEQFNRSIPYLAISQSFSELIRKILAESEESIKQWKNQFAEVFENSGKIIVDIIPDLEIIIGKQPDLPEVAPLQKENRFRFYFNKFVSLFCSNKHPLVLFLDDLQWVDFSSLNLIEHLLISGELNNFLIIGCYRNEEVGSNHPLRATIKKLSNQSIITTKIELELLKCDDVIILLADTLDSKKTYVEGLAELCVSKTSGNPFYLNAYLKFLYEEGYLVYTENKCTWDEKHIRETEITENVTALMKLKINQLPKVSKEVLKHAACIGNIFDLLMLTKIMPLSNSEIIFGLNKIVVEGLIVPISQNSNILENAIKQKGSIFKFVHDKIHLEAYNLFKKNEREKAHLTIGNILLDDNKSKIDEILFDAITHLNNGRKLISDIDEKKRLVELNLLAGKKAKASSAYDSANKYFEITFEYIELFTWENDYLLCKTLYEEHAELLQLIGDYSKVNSLSKIVLNNIFNPIEKIRIHEILIRANVSQCNYDEAIKIALSLLREFNINLPQKPSKYRVPFSLLRVYFALIGKKIADLNNLPKMEDETSLAILRLTFVIGSSCYVENPNLLVLIIVKSTLLSIKHGNSPESAQLYVTLGLILSSGFGMIDLGYKFGEIGMSVASKFRSKEVEPTNSFLFTAYILHWKKHLNVVLKYQKNLYQNCLDAGNNEFAAYCISMTTIIKFFLGKKLNILIDEVAQETEKIKNLNQINVYHENQIFCQLIQILSGKDKASSVLTGSIIQEEKFIYEIEQLEEKMTLFTFYFMKSFLSFLTSDFKLAEKWIILTDKYFESQSGSVYHPIYFYYSALIKLSRISETNKKHSMLREVKKIKKKLRKWAFHSPENHLHRYYLVEAEYSNQKGEYNKAMTFYSKAIKNAKESNYLIEEAIANELASKFYFKNNQKRMGITYIQDAYNTYEKWGAKLKLDKIKKDYPQISSENQYKENSNNGIIKETELDKNTLLKATETISKEKSIKKLISSLVKILIENAGAETGYFLLNENEKFVVNCKGIIDKENRDIDSVDFEKTDFLPKTIINYCINTKETICIDNAHKDSRFSNDPYLLEFRPKSILCSPLLQQNKLVAIYYLENRLLSNTFNKNKLETLQLLSSQISVTIENARLYSIMETKVKDRTKTLEDELTKAATYVRTLLPEKLDGKIKTDWKFVPSHHVSGDSFGYKWLDENNFALYLIDVSGHGLEAAMLSTFILNTINSQSLPKTDFANPSEVLNSLNKMFDMEEHAGKFFSIWYGVINISSYELICSSAFHPPATCVRRGSLFSIGKGDIMIGAFEDYQFETITSKLEKGDRLYLYSDGCFEFEIDKSVNFEFDDFQETLLKNNSGSASVEEIFNTLLSMNISNSFDDDYSMVEIIL